MTPSDYEYLRKLLKERSGLDLSADKQYLVESRLAPLARKSGLPGIPELVQKMKGGADALTAEVVEAMTTNETFFFRDKLPFDHMKETVIPALVQARAATVPSCWFSIRATSASSAPNRRVIRSLTRKATSRPQPASSAMIGANASRVQNS